jgi:hypothetical protein
MTPCHDRFPSQSLSAPIVDCVWYVLASSNTRRGDLVAGWLLGRRAQASWLVNATLRLSGKVMNR